MITLQELSARLNAGQEAQQKVIESIRLGVISLFETHTQRLWNRRVAYIDVQRPDELIRTRDRAMLWLPLYPVELLSISEHAHGDADAAVSSDDIDVDAVSGRVTRVNGYWQDVVTMTITGGYTSETAPADVRESLMAQMMFCYSRLSPSTIAMASQSFQVGSTQYLSADFHPLFSQAMGVHRRRAYS